VPTKYPERDGGFNQIEVDMRGSRWPTFEVPNNLSFAKAFDDKAQLEAFDEDIMLRERYQKSGLGMSLCILHFCQQS
jgi:hypothetical protein